MSSIFVGNLNWEASEADLHDLFSRYGEIKSCKIVLDRETKRPRGFAFIDMPNAEEAKEAIYSLNSFEYMGRQLNVNEARPAVHKQKTPYRGGGGNRGGNNRGGRGGDNDWGA
jgi:RNA recognition motif-containing protein